MNKSESENGQYLQLVRDDTFAETRTDSQPKPDEAIEASRRSLKDRILNALGITGRREKKQYQSEMEGLFSRGLVEQALFLLQEKGLSVSYEMLVSSGDFCVNRLSSLFDENPGQSFEKYGIWIKRAASAYYKANDMERLLLLADVLIDRGLIAEGRYLTLMVSSRS